MIHFPAQRRYEGGEETPLKGDVMRTGSARVSFKVVTCLVVLLATMLLGPAPIKAANPLPQGNAYTFGPIGVIEGQAVHLAYHNFTTEPVQVRFLLLDAAGQDLFVVHKINATFIVEPGTMVTDVMPCDGILGPNQIRGEVTGVVALWRVPPQKPFKPGTVVGPASVQIVDEATQQTLVVAGVVTPSDLAGAIGPVD
jgi:hypothetical protein